VGGVADPMSKIRSASLQARAAAGDGDTVVVVVEIGPPPQSRPTPKREAGSPILGAFEFTGESDEALILGAKQDIEQLGGAVTTVLKWSSSLVVEIPAKQLMQVADLDAVTAVWPNERG